MRSFAISSGHVVAAVVMVLVGIVGVSAVGAQETPVPPLAVPSQFPANTITVTGTGTASAEPDVAYVELGVEMMDANLGTAFSQAAENMQSVINALVELGVAREDIRTAAVNVFPQDNYDPQTGMPTDRTYRVINTVRITVRDVAMVESVINTAVNAGANTINSFYFGIEDTAALEETARAEAVANARMHADQLAAALGVTVGNPVIVSEAQGQQSPIPLPYGVGGAAMARDIAQSLPIESGQLSITVQVLVTYTMQ